MGETAPLCNHHWRVGEHLSIFLKVKLHFQRLRWDYLIPDDTDYESQAYTQNPKLKAFNWIKRHGTTMKQVLFSANFDIPQLLQRWFLSSLPLICLPGLPWQPVSTPRTPEWSGTTCTTSRTSRCSTGTMTWPAWTGGGPRGSPSGW